jgi:hypothetical protein
VRAQPADATPSNQLTRQYFTLRTVLSAGTQLDLARQRSVPFELTLANDFWLSRLLQAAVGLVLRRPIETAALTILWIQVSGNATNQDLVLSAFPITFLRTIASLKLQTQSEGDHAWRAITAQTNAK